tara:strand:+ start:905 stop:1573 length:669 start_codon:yes stop_codon:yes gene_type:complete
MRTFLPESKNQTDNTKAIIKVASNRNKSIATVAIFAAINILLHLSPLKIPAPFAPFLIFEIWEIPIFTAFYLYGVRIGVTITILNFLSLLVIFPGQLQAGPIYNLIAILAMMFGILLAYRIIGLSSKFQGQTMPFLLAMILGPLLRVLVMTPVNAVMLPMPSPLGFNLPIGELEQVLGIPPGTMLLFIAIFNALVALYTIPYARIITTAISSKTRITPKYGV